MKSVKNGVFSGPYFPLFGLNTEINFVNLRIQSKYRKIRTRKYSVFGHFSHSATVSDLVEHDESLTDDATIFEISSSLPTCIVLVLMPDGKLNAKIR